MKEPSNTRRNRQELQKRNFIWKTEQLDAIQCVAIVYMMQNRYPAAEELCKQALEIREKTLETEHPNIAAHLDNLAEFYMAQLFFPGEITRGRLLLGNKESLQAVEEMCDKIEPLYKRSLEIRKKAMGSEHPDTVESYIRLGRICRMHKKYDEAERLFNRALEIRRKLWGLNIRTWQSAIIKWA